MTQANDPARSKAQLIQAFFDEFSARVRFIADLAAAGRDIEATHLCCAYTEAIANNLYPSSTDSAANFSRALGDFGGDEFLVAIHPSFLIEGISAAKRGGQGCARKVARICGQSRRSHLG